MARFPQTGLNAYFYIGLLEEALFDPLGFWHRADSASNRFAFVRCQLTQHYKVGGRPLLTNQLANVLGLQSQTVRKLRVLGTGPPFIHLGDRPGARVVYRRSDIEDWLAARVKRNSAE